MSACALLVAFGPLVLPSLVLPLPPMPAPERPLAVHVAPDPRRLRFNVRPESWR